MHGEIKGFHLEGEMADRNVVQSKETLIQAVEDGMRDQGYVPVLDLQPQFTVQYVAEKESFNFKLTVYGTYVGEKAWLVAGTTNGKRVKRYIPQTRSKPSSTMQG